MLVTTILVMVFVNNSLVVIVASVRSWLFSNFVIWNSFDQVLLLFS